jgi:hypothetical protein
MVKNSTARDIIRISAVVNTTPDEKNEKKPRNSEKKHKFKNFETILKNISKIFLFVFYCIDQV